VDICHNIPNPESVSDHIWRVSTLYFLLADDDDDDNNEKGDVIVDISKYTQMALYHVI